MFGITQAKYIKGLQHVYNMFGSSVDQEVWVLHGAYFEVIGIKEGKQLKCDKFIKGFSRFAAQEHAKKGEG